MSNDKLFKSALGHVLENEGGYNDIKDDRGGATNFGISLVFLQTLPEHQGDIDGDGDVDKDDIKKLSLENVYNIYKKNFWDKYVTNKLWASDSTLRPVLDELKIYVFDMYVNHSPRAVNLMLQRAINCCMGDVLVEDGIWGSKSDHWFRESTHKPDSFLSALRSERHAYYRELVLKNDSQRKFLKGWRKRALRKL